MQSGRGWRGGPSRLLVSALMLLYFVDLTVAAAVHFDDSELAPFSGSASGAGPRDFVEDPTPTQSSRTTSPPSDGNRGVFMISARMIGSVFV